MDLRCKNGGTFDHIGITEALSNNNKTVLKLFDTFTGEIFQNSSYKITPYKEVTPTPRYAKSEEQALDFRSTVDKFHTKPDDYYFGEIENIKASHGEKALVQILKLTKYVKVHNVAFIKRDELIGIMGCSAANLNRKLNHLAKKNILQFETKGMTVPKTVKILLNPFYFWFGAPDSRIREWMSHWCIKAESIIEREKSIVEEREDILDNVVDEYITGYDINIGEPDKRYVKGEVTKGLMYKDTKKSSTLTQKDLIYLIHGV